MKPWMLFLALLLATSAVFADTEKITPNADSAVALSRSTGAHNYTCIDETDTTLNTADYVYLAVASGGSDTKDDLYDLPDPSVVTAADAITAVDVYAYVWKSTAVTGHAHLLVQENSTLTESEIRAVPPISEGAGWITYSWATRPSDGTNWTFTDLQNMQAGIRLTQAGGGGGAGTTSYCAALYVTVTYTTASGSQVILVVPEQTWGGAAARSLASAGPRTSSGPIRRSIRRPALLAVPPAARVGKRDGRHWLLSHETSAPALLPCRPGTAPGQSVPEAAPALDRRVVAW